MHHIDWRRHKSHNSRAAAVIFLWLLVIVDGNATEIAVVVTDNSAVLATDSLFLVRGVVPTQGCKINQVSAQNLFWAAAGISSDPLTGFDVADFFASVKEQPVDKILDAIAPKLISPLEKEIPIIKRLEPSIYAEMSRGGFILTLAVVGIEEGHPATYWKDFAVIGDRVIPKESVTCRPVGMPPQCSIVNIPESMRYVATNPKIWNGTTMDAIDELMRVGQAARPKSIGPPFSIVLIRPEGSKWLRRNDCPRIKTINTRKTARRDPQ